MSSLFGRPLQVAEQNPGNQVVKKSYEMGYTPDEFSKTLHSQFIQTQSAYILSNLGETHWQVILDNQTVTPASADIKISQQTPRQIAMLKLPLLKVEFLFSHATTEQQNQFEKRFFKYFHKGGG